MLVMAFTGRQSSRAREVSVETGITCRFAPTLGVGWLPLTHGPELPSSRPGPPEAARRVPRPRREVVRRGGHGHRGLQRAILDPVPPVRPDPGEQGVRGRAAAAAPAAGG